MNTAHILRLSHRHLKILPWYVNRTLDPKKARKVAAHLSRCSTCQREVDALAKVFSAQNRAQSKRPVSQARLDAVMYRIDRYEQQRPRPTNTERVSLQERLKRLFPGWLTAQPVLVAGACAAVVLAILVAPMLRAPTAETQYRVLSSSEPAAQQLRIRLRFSVAATPDAVEQLVRSSLAQHKLANAFRIEPRQDGEYLVVFEQQPAIAALSGLLDDWRRAPNVTDVAIDAE